MPLIRISAEGDEPILHRSTRSFGQDLARKDTSNGPVIVMIHGYKYLPGHPVHCPHGHIMALHPRDMPFRPPSWPRQLGFGVGHKDEGLAIAFGWKARGFLWQAQASAKRAGQALAKVINQIRDRSPTRSIHVIAHSMGIELALEALHHVAPGAISRIISMTGASYQSRTLGALDTPAGRAAEFINVTSRENDVFDFMFERLIAPPAPNDRAIGHGLSASNAVNLQIDCPGTLDHLDRIGLPVGATERVICHWSSYTRPGLLRCYNAFMRQPDMFPLGLLQRGVPDRCDPRWSRFLPRPATSAPLPFLQKAS